MTCDKCPKLKRFFCIIACEEVNKILNEQVGMVKRKAVLRSLKDGRVK